MKCVTTTLRRFSHWHFREIKRTPKQSHKWQIRFYSSLFFYNYTHFKCNSILQSLSFALVFFRFCIWLWNYIKLRMSSPLSFMCESLMLRRPILLSCFFLSLCMCIRQQQFSMIVFTSAKRLFARIINYHLVFFSFCRTLPKKIFYKRLNHMQMPQLFQLTAKFALFSTLNYHFTHIMQLLW